MVIKRAVHGESVEITLTDDEVIETWKEHQLSLDKTKVITWLEEICERGVIQKWELEDALSSEHLILCMVDDMRFYMSSGNMSEYDAFMLAVEKWQEGDWYK